MYDMTRAMARVEKILENKPEVQVIKVRLEDNTAARAINYLRLTGEVNEDDRVLLNTTAVELGLGTGGYHFVISSQMSSRNKNCVTGRDGVNNKAGAIREKGHIMKIKYTPFQIKTLSMEEEDSPYHHLFNNTANLGDMKVIIIPLHSLLAPVAFVFKYFCPEKKLIYLMTEGGSLSLDFSHQVTELKRRGMIDSTITTGQSFGGDMETVNIFTGLIAAHRAACADLIVAGMGPGITGTGTRLGFSGVENAFINYAVDVLGGKSIIVPRISLAEKRARHYPLSHHTLTLLQILIKNKVDVVFPDLKLLKDKIEETELKQEHNLYFFDTGKIEKIEYILQQTDFGFNSMGRSFTDDPLFFITGGLAVLRYRDILGEDTNE